MTMVPPADHDALLETLDVLSDQTAMADIAAYRAAPNDVVPLAAVEAELRDAGRLPS